MIPSLRLYLLLLSGIVVAPLLAILFNQQLSLIITLSFDCLMLALAGWDAQRVKTHRVEIERTLAPRLSIGRDNPVILLVKSSQQPAQIMIQDSYPQEFSVFPAMIRANLEANTHQELAYTIHPDQRGEFIWGDIQVRQKGAWGLAWYDWRIPANEKVAVYPDLVGLRSLSVRLSLESTGTMRRKRSWGIGTEFAELREYSTGDDSRMIDWKATARRSRPLVRVLEPEKEQTLIILLDRGRLMTAKVQGMQRFDWGLNATLSLALAGLRRGDRIGVAVFDKQISTWIPPERGQQQLSRLLEHLTPIQPELLEPDYFGTVTKIVTQQTRRALVVLITDLVDNTASAELLAAMMRLTPRYLPFCVALRDPQIDNLAHNQTNSLTIEAAYTRAVALDLLAQRQIAFAQLKQRGVLVLDAPVDQISAQLVERYLQLKAKNLL